MNVAYILEECEVGMISYLSSSMANPAFNYYRGLDTSDKDTPAVIVQATQADEDFLGSGVWHVAMRCYFIYPYEGTGSLNTRNDAYNTYTGILYSSMSLSNVTHSTSHLAVYDIFGKGISNSIQQDHWVSENEFEFVAVYK